MEAVTLQSRPLVHEQFDDIEQQREAAKLGMWIFLATEVLFFGGLFLGYTIYRFTYGQVFMETSRNLDKNEKNLPNSNNFTKILKLLFINYYYLLLNLNIFIDIRRFRAFYNLLVY